MTVTKENQGKRLDVYLASINLAQAVTRAQARRLCKAKRVLVNDRLKPPGYLLSLGDVVELLEAETKEISEPLQVVYENEHLLVIEKPRGIHSVDQFASSEPSIESLLGDYFVANQKNIEKSTLKENGLIQRLDYWTSGLMLVAKDTSTEKYLRSSLEAGKIFKTYVAWVLDLARWEQQEVNAAIDANKRKKVVISETGAPAKSTMKVMYRDESSLTSLLEVSGTAMRRHQVRVHAASLGHPLVGDDLYLGTSSNNLGNVRLRPQAGGGFFLHANYLAFVDVAGQRRSWRSDEWKKWPVADAFAVNDK